MDTLQKTLRKSIKSKETTTIGVVLGRAPVVMVVVSFDFVDLRCV